MIQFFNKEWIVLALNQFLEAFLEKLQSKLSLISYYGNFLICKEINAPSDHNIILLTLNTWKPIVGANEWYDN